MLTIPEISKLTSSDLTEVSKLLHEIELHPITCNNWPEMFPYTPLAAFNMAHNGTELFIRFVVQEECSMARVTEDNGEVWTDSCVEFFISLDHTGYYNFEFNCIGKALLGFRKQRSSAIHATQEIMQTIKRLPSLGMANFEEKKINKSWELVVAIPATSLFKHQLKSWQDLTANINVYKCGDHLSRPHYLSWNPIDTPKPDFHVERCFKKIRF